MGDKLLEQVLIGRNAPPRQKSIDPNAEHFPFSAQSLTGGDLVLTNAHLEQRRLAAVPRGVAVAAPIHVATAFGSEIWDVEGRRYIDFAGGIAVLNVGHRHPRVMERVRAQLENYTHTAFQVMAYEPYIALSERLNALAPFSDIAKTLLVTTGAEAAENAVKIARAATGRSAIIAFSGGFHGRTMMTMAMTGKVSPYKRGFGPMPADVYHLPFPVAHYGVSVDDSLRALDLLFAADVDPNRVAAIMIEPVQGEGGVHQAPDELLSALRTRCDQHGILLIADEVQTGFARTGKMFAIEHSGVEPDLVAIAKSLAGGFPLAGVIGRARIMDAVEPGGLGGTYAGSPIACAAAHAVLDIIADEELCARALELGRKIKEKLAVFKEDRDLIPIGNIRGLGAMIAFDCLAAPDGSAASGGAAKNLVSRAREQGLIILSCGVFGEAIRLLMPLTSTPEVVDEGLELLRLALRRG
jgi:4-aminobutyrate aminotransferase / (S)-3-amino-2-methylpropionate transaminase / 5-aminovalerate transaminase